MSSLVREHRPGSEMGEIKVSKSGWENIMKKGGQREPVLFVCVACL